MGTSIQTVSGQSRLRLGCAVAKQNFVNIGSSWNVARVGILFGIDARGFASYNASSISALSDYNYITLLLGFCRSSGVFPYTHTSEFINAVGVGTVSTNGAVVDTRFDFFQSGSGALTYFNWPADRVVSTRGATFTGGNLPVPIDGRKTILVVEFNQTTFQLRTAYPASSLHTGFDLTEADLDRAMRAATFDGVVEYLDDLVESTGGAVATRFLLNSTVLGTAPSALDAAFLYFSRELHLALQVRRIRAIKIS